VSEAQPRAQVLVAAATEELATLRASHASLSGEHATLRTAHEELAVLHDELSSKHQAQIAKYTSLATKFTALVLAHESLQEENGALVAQQGALASDRSARRDEAEAAERRVERRVETERLRDLGSDPISLAEIQSELQARAQLEERVQRAEERAMVAEARAEAAAKTARTLGGTVPQMDASTDPQPSEVQHQDAATEPARVLLRDVATGTTLATLPMPAAEAVPLGGVPLGGEGLPASEDAWRERLAQQQEEIARLDAAIGAAASGSMADASLLEAVPKRSHEESAPAEEAQEAVAEAGGEPGA